MTSVKSRRSINRRIRKSQPMVHRRNRKTGCSGFGKARPHHHVRRSKIKRAKCQPDQNNSKNHKGQRQNPSRVKSCHVADSHAALLGTAAYGGGSGLSQPGVPGQTRYLVAPYGATSNTMGHAAHAMRPPRLGNPSLMGYAGNDYHQGAMPMPCGHLQPQPVLRPATVEPQHPHVVHQFHALHSKAKRDLAIKPLCQEYPPYVGCGRWHRLMMQEEAKKGGIVALLQVMFCCCCNVDAQTTTEDQLTNYGYIV